MPSVIVFLTFIIIYILNRYTKKCYTVGLITQYTLLNSYKLLEKI